MRSAASPGALGRLLREAAWCGAVAAPCVDAIIQLRYAAAPPVVAAALGGAAVALLVWAWRSGSRTRALALGAPLATLLLWQLELAVLQQAFGRLTGV